MYIKGDVDLKAELSQLVPKGSRREVQVTVHADGVVYQAGKLPLSWMNRGNTLGLDLPKRWGGLVGSSGNIEKWERVGKLAPDALHLMLWLKDGMAGEESAGSDEVGARGDCVVSWRALQGLGTAWCRSMQDVPL